MRNRAAEEQVREGVVLISRGFSGCVFFAFLTSLLIWMTHPDWQSAGYLEVPVTLSMLAAVLSMLMLLHGITKTILGYRDIRRTKL